MGGGVFELGNAEWRGAQAVLEIQVGGGGQKTMPSVVGVWLFSGITQYFLYFKVVNYDGVSKNVTAVGFHEDGKWMYTGGEDCSARIWDLRYLCFSQCLGN